MNKAFKNKIKEQAEKLYAEQRHEDIIELLVPLDVKDDYDLALILIRAFLDVSENKDDEILDSAEMLLMLFPNASNDPRWVYQLARAYFYKERYCEAYRELVNAEKLAEAGEPFPEREEAKELLDMAKEEFDKVSAVKYSDSEKKAVLKHITEHFGRIDKLISQKDFKGVSIEVAEVLPDTEEGRNYYTLVTVGVGAHKMKVAPPYDKMVSDRCEIVMYLPPEMDDDMRIWAVGYMCIIGRLPIERNSWSSYGHIFSNGRPLMYGTKLCASTLIEVQDVDEDASACTLPGGDKVTFYQLFPLYKEEIEYKLSHGLTDLIRKMPHISAVLDLERENVCLNNKNDDNTTVSRAENVRSSPLLVEETDYVSDCGIGEYCTASRLITEKGYRVGYMRRFFIDRGEGRDIYGDSGWLFMSGRETGEFLSDPTNIEICRLNTVCNIDADVVPFLTEPYNTVVARGTDGRLHIEPEDHSDILLS